MATSHRILVPVDQTGLLRVKQREESAAKATELLQKDLQKHHVFFNKRGFHNHIVHHLLALYGTGASPDDLIKAYDANTSYQVAARPADQAIVQELKRGWSSDCPYLGVGDRYPDFLEFFQDEIDENGWEAVLQEYVFKGDERSHTMMERLFAGLLHPMIQVMYGIEWNQAGIIAEGLAQAAAHKNHIGIILTEMEQKASSSSSSSSPSAINIPELFEGIRQNEKLVRSAHYDDTENQARGVLIRGVDEMAQVLSNVKVRPEQVDQKTAEMIHTIAYIVSSTAFDPRRGREPRWDFFLMHHLNASLFFVSLNKLPFITPAQKARLLEWKIRFDIIQYVAQGSPAINFSAVQSQALLPPPTANDANNANVDATAAAVPRNPRDLFARFHQVVDDGHTIKAVRALLIAQELSGKYAGERWIRFADEDAWLRAHYLLLRGTESGPPRWVFGVGFEEAWEAVPLAK